jgi:hypothetical protein
MTQKKRPNRPPAAPPAAKQQPSPSAPAAPALTTEQLAPPPGAIVELHTSREAQAAQAEIEAFTVRASRHRRNPDQIFQELMRVCSRPTFAENVAYAYPRGGDKRCRHEWHGTRCAHCEATLVTGPSVYLAREALRIWGNAWCEMRVLEDDEQSRLIEVRVLDFETSYLKSSQDRFKKLVYRKIGGWIPADERELRELTNRRAAFCERNAALQLLPRDLIEDALYQAERVLVSAAQKDPEGERKKIIMGFDQLNVSVSMLEEMLGHKVGECSPAELAKLRSIWKSIEDGQARWADVVGSGSEEPQAKAKAAAAVPADTAAAGPQPSNAPAGAGIENHITLPQIGLFWGTVKKRGWTDATAHAELAKVFTYTSLKQIPKEPRDVFDAILKHFIDTPAPSAAAPTQQ